ncbi:Mitochondrial ribosomal subunit S27, partial [Rhizoctonia solani]
MASVIASLVAPSKNRIQDLLRLRCSIFGTSYNPTSVRTGAKYLRARLKGPSMLRYYPETLSFKKINAMFPKGDLDLPDYDEWQRLIDVGNRKARGKGAPKKAKTPADSRRLAKKRK